MKEFKKLNPIRESLNKFRDLQISSKLASNWCRAMSQAVSRQPFATEARVRVWTSPCGICGQSGIGTDFSPSSWVFPLSISFRRGCPYSYIIWGMNSRPARGRISETQCQPIDVTCASNSPPHSHQFLKVECLKKVKKCWWHRNES
jgi:hypothetical protein